MNTRTPVKAMSNARYLKSGSRVRVGSWPSENAWERAERARVYLAIIGVLTMAESDKVGQRIEKNFKEHQKHKP